MDFSSILGKSQPQAVAWSAGAIDETGSFIGQLQFCSVIHRPAAFKAKIAAKLL